MGVSVDIGVGVGSGVGISVGVGIGVGVSIIPAATSRAAVTHPEVVTIPTRIAIITNPITIWKNRIVFALISSIIGHHSCGDVKAALSHLLNLRLNCQCLKPSQFGEAFFL